MPRYIRVKQIATQDATTRVARHGVWQCLQADFTTEHHQVTLVKINISNRACSLNTYIITRPNQSDRSQSPWLICITSVVGDTSILTGFCSVGGPNVVMQWFLSKKLLMNHWWNIDEPKFNLNSTNFYPNMLFIKCLSNKFNKSTSLHHRPHHLQVPESHFPA